MHNKKNFEKPIKQMVNEVGKMISSLGSENLDNAYMVIDDGNGDPKVYDITEDVRSIPVIPEQSKQITDHTVEEQPCHYDEYTSEDRAKCTTSRSNLTPAVLFENSVYTPDGSYRIRNSIYNSFEEVNTKLMRESIARLTEDNCYYEEFAIKTACMNNIYTIISNFEVILNNCLLAHLTNISSIFSVDGVPAIDLTKPHNGKSIFGPRLYDIDNNITSEVMYATSSKDQQEMFASGFVMDKAIAYVHYLGNEIYTYIRMAINEFLANISVTDEAVIGKIFSGVDAEFCRMMQDFIYEAGVFVYHLENVIKNRPTPEDFKKLNEISRAHFKDEDNMNETTF